jgi:hypothetical protein
VDRGGRILQKLGGRYWCGCDAPWLGAGLTSPVRKIEGNFCKRILTSSGTESVFFLKTGGGSERELFSLRLKLDDFTSGFWTTVSAVKTETSKKIRQKKRLVFFPDFFYMRCPCPFLQVDSVSLCSDSVLSSKSGISKK